MSEVPFRRFHVDGTLPTDPQEIFTFGSNLAGRHGKGAAQVARDLFSAAYGFGRGPMGRCYAIPTKDQFLRPLTFGDICIVVEEFVEYTHQNTDLKFFVTAVGCGLRQLGNDRMAPLFEKAINCNFPDVWQPYFQIENRPW